MGHYMTKEERIIMQTLLDEKKPVSYICLLYTSPSPRDTR